MDTARMVLGSVAIYIVVAACSSSNSVVTYPSDGGKTTDAKGADAKMADAKHSITDALTDPVREAMADVNQGGSRLKAQHYAGSDGSSQFVGFYDTMLKVQCTFEIATDQSTRCLPSGTAVGLVASYSDSGCTQHIASVLKACPTTPTYAAEAVGSAGCPDTPEVEVYNIGTAYTGTVYAGTMANCAALTSAQTANYNFFTLGSTVPSTSFVSATLQNE